MTDITTQLDTTEAVRLAADRGCRDCDQKRLLDALDAAEAEGQAAVEQRDAALADPRAEVRREAAKFQAETRTSWFLSSLLRQAVGAATRCQRCNTAKGSLVSVGDGDVRAWICGTCSSGEPVDPRPRIVGFGEVTG